MIYYSSHLSGHSKTTQSPPKPGFISFQHNAVELVFTSKCGSRLRCVIRLLDYGCGELFWELSAVQMPFTRLVVVYTGIVFAILLYYSAHSHWQWTARAREYARIPHFLRARAPSSSWTACVVHVCSAGAVCVCVCRGNDDAADDAPSQSARRVGVNGLFSCGDNTLIYAVRWFACRVLNCAHWPKWQIVVCVLLNMGFTTTNIARARGGSLNDARFDVISSYLALRWRCVPARTTPCHVHCKEQGAQVN